MMVEVGVFLAVISLIVGMVYFFGGKLIERYYKASDSLELARNTRFKDSITSLKEVIDDHKRELRHIIHDLQELDKRLYKLQVQIEKVINEQSLLQTVVQRHAEKVDRRLTNLELGKVIIKETTEG